MKIVTWNINSVRLRIDLLEQLKNKIAPDVICLQETKTTDDKFPLEAIRKLGFEHIVYTGEKSYNGVAILSKFPIKNSFSLNLYNDDKRHIAANILDLEVHNFYVPAGGDIPDIDENPKFKHKLEFVKLIKKWFIEERLKDNEKIILLGDLNIAPHQQDVWSSRQLRNVVSHTDIEREHLKDLQHSLNFIDTGRYFVDMQEKLYTWWSYRNRDWKKSNRGRRLDHIWTSHNLEGNLSQIEVLKDARDWLKPSDHVPFTLYLK
ncbi:MAG: exodeoxyribonuclease III [Rickettsiaceae bacterium]|nr:exodeoxyribonuclease III [Rickettsiaceae bacterium]